VKKLLLLVLLLAGCHRQEAYSKPPIAVKVQTASLTQYESTSAYSGTVRAHAQIDLAFKVAGYVDSIASVTPPPSKTNRKAQSRWLQAGDAVTRGTLLASLRESDFKQRVSELSGMSAESQAGLTNAAKDYARAKMLFADGAIPLADLDAAKSRYQSLAGGAQAAGARVQQAATLLSDSQLKAPFDGILLERRVDVGALVQPNVPAFVLADTSTVKVAFGVPDSVQKDLPLGVAALITTDALPGRIFEGTVTKVGAQADARTRVFDVEVSIDNADGMLKVGLVASVQLGKNAPHAGAQLLVPLSAIVRPSGSNEGYAVFVTDDANVARQRTVQLGDLVGNRVAIAAGLKDKERVVVLGATLLGDGQVVTIIP
jgi:RND family efflux transporter MFP subunit